MDARAVSIKNDPEATHTMVGGLYWYPTKYGTGHTGFIYSWEKKNSDKFVGLDGNYSNKVGFVQRFKSKHAKYVSDPYAQVSLTNTVVTQKKKPKTEVIPSLNIPESVALRIDAGLVKNDPKDFLIYRLKIIALLCCITLIFNMLHERSKKANQYHI